MQFHCWKCDEGVQLAPGSRVGAREACPRCDADWHSCRNCQFYDPAKHNQCAEPQAEWVCDKEAANYCDYFRPHPGRRAASRPSASASARQKFDSLFKS